MRGGAPTSFSGTPLRKAAHAVQCTHCIKRLFPCTEPGGEGTIHVRSKKRPHIQHLLYVRCVTFFSILSCVFIFKASFSFSLCFQCIGCIDRLLQLCTFLPSHFPRCTMQRDFPAIIAFYPRLVLAKTKHG